MSGVAAVFQPELIELMKAVLDDAAAMLPEAKRTSAMKAEIASHILACAAKGERNPKVLKIAALSAVVDRHDGLSRLSRWGKGPLPFVSGVSSTSQLEFRNRLLGGPFVRVIMCSAP